MVKKHKNVMEYNNNCIFAVSYPRSRASTGWVRGTFLIWRLLDALFFADETSQV